MLSSPLIHCGPPFLRTVAIQLHDRLSTAQIQMDQMKVCCVLMNTRLCLANMSLTSPGTSRTMETALRSTTEGVRSKIEETMQPITLYPSCTSHSASNRTTPCFSNYTHDQINFPYSSDINQACGSLPGLSLLDNLLDHDPTILSDSRDTAESQSIVNDWNLE
jgi:hypothetical protein